MIFVSHQKTCEILGINAKTLYRWRFASAVQSPMLKPLPYEKIGRAQYFDFDELCAWLEVDRKISQRILRAKVTSQMLVEKKHIVVVV